MSKKLLENYEKVVNDIIEHFCEKQELDFEYWVADCVGEVACFGDIFLGFNDIVHDLKNNAPQHLITDWYWDNVENTGKEINYYSHIKGLRISDIKPIEFECDNPHCEDKRDAE